MGAEGISGVESRISQIQSTIAALTPQASRPAVATASASGQPGGATTGDEASSFAAQLETALAQPGASSPVTTGSTAPASGAATRTSAASAAASSSSASSSSGGTASGNAIVETAKKYLGTPYVWGGNSPSQGFDCSGLVKYVMNELGVDMPRVARDQAKVGTEIGSLTEAQPGDLLGMRNGKHIAIYLGDNKILHAPQPGENVSIRSLFSWDDIDTIRRVVPAGSAAFSGDQAARAAFEQRAGAAA